MDTERPSKKRRIQNRGEMSNPFLDVEARVDDEEDLSEEETDSEKGLVSDGEEVDDGDFLSHRMLCREYERANEIDWSSFLKRAHNRAYEQPRFDGQQRLLGHNKSLYEFDCKPGMEKVAVSKLTEWISLHLHAAFTTFFARVFLPGRIFAEASSYADAILLASQIPELSTYNVRLVPHGSILELLARGSKTPREQTWVRMKSKQKKLKVYLGDTALLVKAESDLFEVWLIPREGVADGSSRPPQHLLNHRTAGAAIENNTIQGRPVVRVGRKTYSKNGFLILSLPLDCVDYSGEATPTLEEFTVFLGCEALNLITARRTEEMILQNNLCIGDRVRVTTGCLQGLSGVILHLSQEVAEVYITSLDVSEAILRKEIRKSFRVGDEVFITTGDHKDKRGWVLEALENKAIIFIVGEYDMIEIPFLHLEFHEEREAVCLRDLARLPKTASEEEWNMRRNANAKFIGKQVIVIGANRWKGYQGIIRDTTPSGEALVEMALFNHQRKERFFLYQLRPSRESQNQLFFMNDNKDKNIPAPPLLQEAPPLPSYPVINMRPTSNPRSEAPAPILGPPSEPPTWLSDSRFRGLRIQVTERGNCNRVLEVKSVDDGIITVRDHTSTRTLPLSQVAAVTPTRKEDPVVSFANDSSFGKLYKIKNLGEEECEVRDFGARSGRGEILYKLSTPYLAVIYPPLKN